ncbi:hypothetical protein JXA02_03780 [candidate division KSB1 bacterium]|nr:hypothetical protein [candidate division KSB1 bacterium]
MLTKRVVHITIFALGLLLIIAGIATGKTGAAIIGLIVAAVNFWQMKKSDAK